MTELCEAPAQNQRRFYFFDKLRGRSHLWERPLCYRSIGMPLSRQPMAMAERLGSSGLPCLGRVSLRMPSSYLAETSSGFTSPT